MDPMMIQNELIQNELHLEIAEHHFTLRFHKPAPGTVLEIAGRLGGFISHCKLDTTPIDIVPFTRNKRFNWKKTDLARFESFFENVEMRCTARPSGKKRMKRPGSLIAYLDPGNTFVRKVLAWTSEPNALMYAIKGNNIYFLNSGLGKLILFIRDAPGISNYYFGVLNGLIFALSDRVLHADGVLIHGAAIQREGITALFVGPSGSGKTTLTRLCRPDVCFSDDVTIIKREKERVFVYPSPFIQNRKTTIPPAIRKGEIKRIFFLRHGRNVNASPMAKSELMGMVLMTGLHFFNSMNDDSIRACFSQLKRIIDRVEAYTLNFNMKKGVWDHIRAVE